MSFFSFGARSIRFKFISTAIVIEVIMLSVLIWNGLRLTNYYLLAETETHLNIMTPLINAGLAGPIVQEDLSTLTEILDRMTMGVSVKYIEIQNANLEVLVKKGHLKPQPWLKRDDFIQYMNEEYKQDRFAFREPIYIGSRIVGYANIQMDISVINVALQSLFNQGLVIGILEIFLTVMFLSLIGYALTRHLATLTDSVKEMAKGDYSQHIHVDSQDEIGAVAYAINHLVDEIELNNKKIIMQNEEIAGLTRLSPVGIFQSNEAGECTYANPRWMELSGLTLEKSLGEGWASAIYLDDRPWVYDSWREAVNKQAVFEVEFRLNNHGETVWVAVRAEPQMENGQLSGYIGSVTDITERKRIESTITALAESSSVNDYDEFLRNVVKSLAGAYQAKYAFVGQLLPDKQSVQTLAVWAGDGFVDNFVYELRGTPCEDIIYEGKQLITCNAWRLYPDDAMLKEMSVEGYYGAPLLGAEGSKLGLITVMDTKPMELLPWVEPVLGMFAARVASEIERQQNTEELEVHRFHLEDLVSLRTAEMEALNHELEAFSYSVSHDLRAPLRSISGFSQALLEDYAEKLGDEGKDYLERVRNGAIKMSTLIDDLLDLSRVSRREINMQEVDLTAIAHDVIAEMQVQNPERIVAVSIEDNMQTRGDEHLLIIVMTNLIGNAWKYTSKRVNASIKIGQHMEDGVSVFYIKDNGAGFDMQHAKKLFGAFQRLHHVSEFEGTGIGLATVKRVINRHGGRVWAQAMPEKGAVFYFTIASYDKDISGISDI
ncbi:MAG: PAS domain S-box protein [Gammaproteobacteria bacterium]|nr:PAS domain S-box protein [Gammaproteobacteria bacterium]